MMRPRVKPRLDSSGPPLLLFGVAVVLLLPLPLPLCRVFVTMGRGPLLVVVTIVLLLLEVGAADCGPPDFVFDELVPVAVVALAAFVVDVVVDDDDAAAFVTPVVPFDVLDVAAAPLLFCDDSSVVAVAEP